MQNNGTLRKRKRRHLVKVKESLVQDACLTDIRSSFESKADGNNKSVGVYQILRNTRAKILGKNHRITRKPSFHLIKIDECLGSLSRLIKSNNAKQSTAESDRDDYSEERAETMIDDDIKHSIEISNNVTAPQDRSYFLDATTIARLKQILLLAICSGTVPWRFNSIAHKIYRWSPALDRLWRLQWYFVTLQTVCLTVFQFYSLISRLKYLQKRSNRELFMNSVSVYWYVCAVYFNINLYIYEDKIRHYINTLFRFNHEFVKKYVVHLNGYKDGGRLVINLSIPSNTCQVFASVALFLVIPHQPWYIFSYIYPKPWYWLIPGALHEFILVGQVISSYILYQWIMIAHSNSVEFWLKEMHNKHETGYTRDTLREYNEGMKCYRKLQILCSCFNECMCYSTLLLKTHILTGLVPCGYVVIRSMNEKFIEEFPGILTYPICVVDCATAGIATLSLAAEVFDLAAGFLDSWSRTKTKEFRRVLLSCPTLKLWVGRYYFITVATTVTFFKVTTDFIINAIIAFP